MRIPITENGNIRKGVDLEEDGEFSSIHGVFDFGHTEFEEKGQVPLPNRQWINRFGTSERDQNSDTNSSQCIK